MYFIAGLILLITIWALIEQNLLMTTKYLITSQKLPREFADTSFIVLSDLHNHSFGTNNRRLIKKIKALSPDFIIVAGDMINKMEKCTPSNAFVLLEKLAKEYQIYYAYGNHEQYIELICKGEYASSGTIQKEKTNQITGNEFKSNKKPHKDESSSTWVEYLKRLKNSGVIFLDNKSIIQTKNSSKIRISGVTIAKQYYGKGDTAAFPTGYLQSLLGNKEANLFQLLVAHNPLYFKEYVNWGADLIISGHLHGGLVRLPFFHGMLSPQIRFFPKYDAGRFKEKDKEMIVSRGLGSHSVMFRLFNPPELVYVKLKK